MLDHILLAIITLFCAVDFWESYQDGKMQKKQQETLDGILTELVIKNSSDMVAEDGQGGQWKLGVKPDGTVTSTKI